MVCYWLSSTIGCCDLDLESTPWLVEQRWETWIIVHQILWIQVRCTIMVCALQFAPSTLFPLEITCKYTQNCAIYRWGQTQFHHSSTLDWLLVGSSGGRVGRLLLFGKEIRYDDCHARLLLFIKTCSCICDLTLWLSEKTHLFPLYSWYHCKCDKSCGTSPRQDLDHFTFPSCGLIQKLWFFLLLCFSSVPLHFTLLYLNAQLFCEHNWAQNLV